MSKKIAWLLVITVVFSFIIGSSFVFGATTDPAGNPSGDALFFSATADSSNMPVKYWYWMISRDDYTFQTGDYLEYDVYLNDKVAGMGALEVYVGGLGMRDFPEFVDQNGLKGHPNTDISAMAYKKWYHRKLPVPKVFCDMAAENWSLAVENPAVNKTFTAFYDNIVVTNKGKVVKTIYKGGQPTENMGRDGCPGYTKLSVVVKQGPPPPTPTPTPTPAIKPVTKLTVTDGSKAMAVAKTAAGKTTNSTATLSNTPFVFDGYLYAPAKEISEQLGATYAWDATKKQMTIKRGTTTIVMTVGISNATVNGRPVAMTPAGTYPFFVPGGKTVVSAEFLAKQLGATYSFASGKATITYQQK